MFLAFLLCLQVIPQLPLPTPEVPIPGEIVGPYIFREDLGQTTKVILKNGLTVILREQNAVPLTSVTIQVKVGYFDETDENVGISHLIEHMFFKGTKHRSASQLAKETRALGGHLNAETDYDRTIYRTVVPAENTVPAMAIQADALWNPIFDLEELNREIEVVVQENDRRLDNASAMASERLHATSFRAHRMGRWRIGTANDLRSFTQDDLKVFYEKYYQPSNIILTLVGRFDREELLGEVLRLHGHAGDQAVERDTGPSEVPQKGFRYNWERGNIGQTHIALGYRVPGILSNDLYVVETLRAILASGRASRLNRFLRDEQGIINNVSTTIQRFQDWSYLEVLIETSDQPERAEIAALKEVERIKRFGVTTEELSRAKALLSQEYYHRVETVDGLADELSSHEAFGDWKRSEEYIPGIQRVKNSDLLRISNLYLTNENLGLFEYLPNHITRSFTADDFEASVLDRVKQTIVPRSIEEFPVSTEVNEQDDALIQDLVRPVVRSSILRGPEVYVVEDHRLPLTSFGIFYPGGRLYEADTNSGITELMLRSALRGTRRYNTSDISRRIENVGSRVQLVNEQDFFGYILNGISGHMGQALEVLMEILQEPTFPEDQVEMERKQQQVDIRLLQYDSFRHPMQLFMSTLFDGHSYARHALGTEKAVASLTRDDLVAWHKLHQRTLVPVIVVVGDTQGTALVASIADALTNEDLFERDIANLPRPDVNVQFEEKVEISKRRQTAIVYGFAGPTNSSPDRFALKVIENAISGFGGKLSETIRDQRGLASSVMASDILLSRSGAVFTYTAFPPENELKVRNLLEKEIRTLSEEGITEKELESAINYSIGVHEMALQTRVKRVLAYAHAFYAGNKIASLQNYSAAIKNVGLGYVKFVAAKYLNPANAKVAIIRAQN